MINKILVVDDSAAIHQIYNMLLARYQGEVISALSGQEGLDKLTEHPDVNLLIVDANMPPHMSGLEFITKVKEQKIFNDIPIILVSAEGADVAKDALAITHGHLRKPFLSKELHTLIDKVFQQNIQPKIVH